MCSQEERLLSIYNHKCFMQFVKFLVISLVYNFIQSLYFLLLSIVASVLWGSIDSLFLVIHVFTLAIRDSLRIH